MTPEQIAKMQAGRQAAENARQRLIADEDAWHIRMHAECAADAAERRAKLLEAS